MADPKAQAEQQLQNILATTGRTVPQFVAEVKAAGLDKHGQMVKHFKATHGLGHGNANLLAHVVRERLAGGPAAPQDLLDAQYARGKAALRPVYERLLAVVEDLGDDVEVVVQKTAVSFRRSRQFARVRAASSKRVELGLNLDESPDPERIVAASGMCSHKTDLRGVEDVDAVVIAALEAAWRRAG